MQLSARNQFSGQVKKVKLGNIMAEVIVGIGRA
jgi:molybdopterin-binding protein